MSKWQIMLSTFDALRYNQLKKLLKKTCSFITFSVETFFAHATKHAETSEKVHIVIVQFASLLFFTCSSAMHTAVPLHLLSVMILPLSASHHHHHHYYSQTTTIEATLIVALIALKKK